MVSDGEQIIRDYEWQRAELSKSLDQVYDSHFAYTYGPKAQELAIDYVHQWIKIIDDKLIKLRILYGPRIKE